MITSITEEELAQIIYHRYPRSAKLYGYSIRVNGKDYLWDHVNNRAIPEKEMLADKELMAASERIKWGKLAESLE